MLKITISIIELYDEVNNEFIPSKEQTLLLEHSLISLSKWESKWHKPFLTDEEKTVKESVDYIKCMTINDVSEDVYNNITDEIIQQVSNYIEEKMTATIFPKEEKKTINREKITSELIYYWMIALNIPFECQKWHLNRLLALINVCNIKNQPPKKMSAQEIMSRNAILNAERRKALNSKG